MNINNQGATIGQQNISSSIINNISGTKPFTQQNINSEVVNNYLSRSAEYGELLEQLEELEEMLEDLPESKEEKREKYRQKIAKHQEKIEQYKQDVFRLAERFSQITINTDRIKRARAFFEDGKFGEADVVLNEAEIEEEQTSLLQASSRKKSELEKLQTQLKENAAEFILKAQTTLLQLDDAENRISRACGFYEKALESDRSGETLFDYANFLQTYRLFDDAMKHYGEALNIFRKETIDDPNRGLAVSNVYYNMANIKALHYDKDGAVELYQLALEVQKALIMTYPNIEEVLEMNVGVSNRVADVMMVHYDFEGAVQMLEHALQTGKELCEMNPAHDLTLALSLNNLGKLHFTVGNDRDAFGLFDQAMTIFVQRHQETNDKSLLPHMAKLQGNLGVIIERHEGFEQAERLLTNSTGLFRMLMEEDPDKYLADYAHSLNNLGVMYLRAKRLEQSTETLSESLSIYRNLTPHNPEVYLPQVALTLGNLAKTYMGLEQLASAREAQEEAFGLYLLLSKERPAVFLPDVARELLSKSMLEMKVMNIEEALKNSLMALDTLMPFVETDSPTQSILDLMHRGLTNCEILGFDATRWLKEYHPDKLWIMKLLEE